MKAKPFVIIRRCLLTVTILSLGLLILSGCDQSNPESNAGTTLTPVNNATPGVGITQVKTEQTVFTPQTSVLDINQELQPVRDIPLPGGTSRFDYQSFDPKAGLLFIAHLGDSSLLAIDVKTNQVVTEIKGLGEVHGVLVVPELGRVFATATSNHQLVVLDEASFKVLARIPAGNYPDGLAYDPLNHKIYVSDEGAEAEPVIDINANKALPSISLGGEAGNTQYDPVSQHIFVNVQTKNEVVEINPKNDQILARYSPGAVCHNNHGLLLDTAERLAFIACDGNAKLLVLDMQAGMKLISIQDTGNDPDVLALDSDKSWLYVACESGIVSIFKINRSTVQKLAEGVLAPSAHTISINSNTDQVFLPLQEVTGKPVLRIMQPRP